MIDEAWTDQYLVSSYEVDARGQLPVPSLGKFLQESAYNNANFLGFGYDQLKDENLFWVLSRLEIRMESYPKWRDKIYIRTWPSGIDGLLAFRDFQILNEDRQVIGSAGSAWLMLDSVRRRPQRMKVFFEKFHHFPGRADTKVKPVKLPNLENPLKKPSFPVRYSDLDLYDHVNNAKYMQWIIDSYPVEMHTKHIISTFEINFLSETRIEDEVFIQTEKIEDQEENLIYLHCIHRKKDERPICHARITWEKS
jgi:acyl-ACP thioesterase